MKSIGTEYKGWHFRSVLEFRWAVVLETLDVPFLFEPQTYEHNGVRYLPDFYIESKNVYVEVKPNLEISDEESEKIKVLEGHIDVLVTPPLEFSQETYDFLDKLTPYPFNESIYREAVYAGRNARPDRGNKPGLHTAEPEYDSDLEVIDEKGPFNIVTTGKYFTATSIAKQLGMQAKDLNKKLEEMEVIEKYVNKWIPKEGYKDYLVGILRQVNNRKTNETWVDIDFKWNQQGVEYILNLLSDKQ